MWFLFRLFVPLSIGIFRFLASSAPRRGYLRPAGSRRPSCSLYHYLYPEEPSSTAFFSPHFRIIWCLYCVYRPEILVVPSRKNVHLLLSSFKWNQLWQFTQISHQRIYVYVSLYVYEEITYLVSEPFVPNLVSGRSQQVVSLKRHTVNILDFEDRTVLVGTFEFFISSSIPSTLPVL